MQTFQRNTVHAAMQSFASELAERGVAARVVAEDDALSVRLEVSHGEEVDFTYEVRASRHSLPDASIGVAEVVLKLKASSALRYTSRRAARTMT